MRLDRRGRRVDVSIMREVRVRKEEVTLNVFQFIYSRTHIDPLVRR